MKILTDFQICISAPLKSQFTENNDKLSDTVTELVNKLTKVSETLERMQSQQAVSETVNESMHKQLLDVERQCWKNEIVGIPDNTQEEKVCKLVSSGTRININPDSL